MSENEIKFVIKKIDGKNKIIKSYINDEFIREFELNLDLYDDRILGSFENNIFFMKDYLFDITNDWNSEMAIKLLKGHVLKILDVKHDEKTEETSKNFLKYCNLAIKEYDKNFTSNRFFRFQKRVFKEFFKNHFEWWN